MRPVTLLDSHAFGLTVTRLCHQLIEDHGELANTAIIGLQPQYESIKAEFDKAISASNGAVKSVTFTGYLAKPDK